MGQAFADAVRARWNELIPPQTLGHANVQLGTLAAV